MVIRDVDEAADFHRIAVLTDCLWNNGLERIEERLAAEHRMFPDRLVVTLIENALEARTGRC